MKSNHAGIAQLVEHHVANVNVAGSSPVSRSFFGGVAKWLRQRSAKPLFSGSNPLAASIACRDGGIGRRKGLKIPCPSGTCRFDSGSRYTITFSVKQPTSLLWAFYHHYILIALICSNKRRIMICYTVSFSTWMG